MALNQKEQGVAGQGQGLLVVENLSVCFGQQRVVDAISFSIDQGETFALVGESGSGKSMTALSVLRLLPSSAKITVEGIRLKEEELAHMTELEFCALRGRRIAMIFQEPMSSLNPVMTIGQQIVEALAKEQPLANSVLQTRALALLKQVEIPDAERRINDYPHQLSGGQRQRVMIAIALAGEPDLLIADEPTTSLDVTVQAQIIVLLKSLQRDSGMSLWFISHDLALVSNIADRVAIMQQGKIVESGVLAEVFNNPRHPYTRKLLDALPSISHIAEENGSAAQPKLMELSHFSCYYPIRRGLFKRIAGYVKAVDDVSFEIRKGKTLALVGESGCGKTTLGKSLLSLLPKTSGEVTVDSLALGDLQGEELRKYRANLQIIFQDPYSSMNPRMLVRDIIGEGIQALHPEISAEIRNQEIDALIKQVGLPEDSALRYPHEFSGGQRQRICIARALAVKPKLIVCDEPTSALDVSVQAQIIALLKKLQQEQGISYLFITHDLAVVAEIADEVAVMQQGRIVEIGSAQQVLTAPQQDYTKKLIGAIPVMRTM
jgi:peptide/nickel transport system ATP-binding protein